MSATPDDPGSPLAPPSPRRQGLPRRTVSALGILLVAYLAIAYVMLPLGWRTYERKRPRLADLPRITHTATGIPGDPLNVGAIGSVDELHRAMRRSGWYPADPITLKSSLGIALGTILHRPYDEAPVSSLFLFGRKQDFAFEKPVGDDPRRRHHVRLWKCDASVHDRPVFVGSATFDERVGLSHTTGEITHHIDGDVDAERDGFTKDLIAGGDVNEVLVLVGFHTHLEGRNGGGDAWWTDGDLNMLELTEKDSGQVEFGVPRPGAIAAAKIPWVKLSATETGTQDPEDLPVLHDATKG